MAKCNLEFHLSSFPWEEPDSSFADRASVLHRGFIVLPFECSSEVICDATKDPLPLVGKWIDGSRRRWSKFELPRGDSPAAQTLIRCTSDLDGTERTFNVPLSPGISRSELDEQLDAEESVPTPLQGYVRIRNFIDQHIQFLNDLNDHLRPNRFYWEGNCNGNQMRSVYRATCRWLHSDDKDNARLALIVMNFPKVGRQ